MEDILLSTRLPALIEKHNALIIGNVTDDDDVVSWYNSLGTQGSSKESSIYQSIAKRAHASLQQVLTGNYTKSPYKLLVNEKNLQNLGLRADLMTQCFKQNAFTNPKTCLPPDKARDAVFLAVYLNTQGLLGSTNVDAILSFYHAWTHRDARPSQAANKTNNATGKDYGSFMSELSREDANALSSANLRLNRKGSQFATIVERQASTLKEDVKDRLMDPTLNAETVLSEFAVQFLEPHFAKCAFEEAVKNYVQLPAVPHAREEMRFDALLKSRKVDLLEGQKNKLTDWLFDIILPKRYRLKSGLTMASAGCLLNVLLGADIKKLKKFYNILTFSFVENCFYSDTIIQNISILEKQMATLNDSSAAWDVMERSWNLCACFIAYLELTRTLIDGFGDVQAGCVDACIGDDCIREGVRQISHNTIYYHDGFYYYREVPEDNNNNNNRQTTANAGYKCTHYKPLLICIWKSKNATSQIE